MSTPLRLDALRVLGLALLSALPLAATPPEPAPDHSLNSAAYIELGLPAPDRRWSGRDYEKALEVLKQASQGDPTRLPRYQSERSGAVFARIVAEDNFAMLGDEALPFDQRFPVALGAMNGLAQMAALYSAPTSDGRVFDAEAVDLLSRMAHVSRAVFSLVRTFLVSLPPDDPDRKVREEGYEQMRQGLVQLTDGLLTCFTEREAYRTSELLRLSTSLEGSLPDLLLYLPPGVQAEVPVRLRTLTAAEQDPALKASLERLQAAVAAAKKD